MGARRIMLASALTLAASGPAAAQDDWRATMQVRRIDTFICSTSVQPDLADCRLDRISPRNLVIDFRQEGEGIRIRVTGGTPGSVLPVDYACFPWQTLTMSIGTEDGQEKTFAGRCRYIARYGEAAIYLQGPVEYADGRLDVLHEVYQIGPGSCLGSLSLRIHDRVELEAYTATCTSSGSLPDASLPAENMLRR